MEIFEPILKQEGDKLIIDNHIPADGTYVVVDICDDKFEVRESFDIKFDKKKKEIEGKSNLYYEYVRMYDYYSKLIEMNKPIDLKKIIHSNNYLSFWVKKDSIQNGKLTDDIIDNYYDILKDPLKKYQAKPKARGIYKEVEKKLGKVDSELLERIRFWIKKNIFNLDIDMKNKDYLKIFFQFKDDNDKTIALYQKESERYLVPNIYNKNDYNEMINEEVYGLPSDNMGLNAKKPYLVTNTRKIKVPYLINNDEVLLQKKFFDYLSSCATKQKFNIYINTDKDEEITKHNIIAKKNGELLEDNDFRGIYLRVQKGISTDIIDYDIISGYRYNLKKKFDYNMYIDVDLKLSKGTEIDYYSTYDNKSDIQNLLNEVYFSKFLKGNYFNEPKEIKLNDNVVKRNLLTCRNSIFNWLYKGYFNDVEAVLNRASLEITKNSVVNGYNVLAIHEFNLRWSFIEYFKGEGKMADFLNEVKTNLREKINCKDNKIIESDMEYYFAIGQEVYYLLSLSKSNNKNQSLINPFLNAKGDAILKEKLRKLFTKYNYAKGLRHDRSSNLYSMILGYRPEGKVDQDMIIAGFLNSNLIYEKKEENEQGDN
nr:type I-B CRISPR-associated protein Cas8b/Csh1 [Intestinibacter bartlettii]